MNNLYKCGEVTLCPGEPFTPFITLWTQTKQHTQRLSILAVHIYFHIQLNLNDTAYKYVFMVLAAWGNDMRPVTYTSIQLQIYSLRPKIKQACSFPPLKHQTSRTFPPPHLDFTLRLAFLIPRSCLQHSSPATPNTSHPYMCRLFYLPFPSKCFAVLNLRQ